MDRGLALQTMRQASQAYDEENHHERRMEQGGPEVERCLDDKCTVQCPQHEFHRSDIQHGGQFGVIRLEQPQCHEPVGKCDAFRFGESWEDLAATKRPGGAAELVPGMAHVRADKGHDGRLNQRRPNTAPEPERWRRLAESRVPIERLRLVKIAGEQKRSRQNRTWKCRNG